MASIDDVDALDELPKALQLTATKILSAFKPKVDTDLETPLNQNPPYEDHTGLHDRLEEASGVDRRSKSGPRTLTQAQRDALSQQLRSASENADKQVLAVRRATETSLELKELEQEVAKIRDEAMKDPRFKRSYEYFAGKKPKEIRQHVINMIIDNLKRSPELINDLLQQIAPEKAIAQAKIDDALAYAEDKSKIAHERIEAAERLQAQIQKNTVVLKEAEVNIMNFASAFQTLQLQKDGVEQSCKSEVEEARQALAQAERDLEGARSDCSNARAGANALQQKLEASNSELRSMKKDLQQAKTNCDTTERARFNEAINYQLSNQKATGLEKKLEAALTSSQTLEKQLELKASQSDKDASTIAQLMAEVDRQKNLINRRANELVQVEDNHKKSQNTIIGLKRERDVLVSRLSTAEGERDELRMSLSTAERERDELKTSLSTAQGESDELRKSSLITESERDDFKLKLSTAQGERDELKTSLSTCQSDNAELVGERDEVKERLALLLNWHNQILVFAELWKITMGQTEDYSPEMFGKMSASLTAVEAFRVNLHSKDIRTQPLPVIRIYGIDDSADPDLRSGMGIVSLFGQLHTNKCKIALETIGTISHALEGTHVRSRRLDLLLLFALLHKRCALAHESAEPCTLAASLVILRCVEILRCHLSGTYLLDLVAEFLDSIKEKLMLDSVLVRAILETLTSDRSLVQCLVSAQEFITIPESTCKVCVDHGMLIAIKDDREVAYIRPCFFRLQVSMFDGWNFVFDRAPMFGSWKTPAWAVRTHLRALLRVLDSAVRQPDQAEPPSAGSVEHELVDVVL